MDLDKQIKTMIVEDSMELIEYLETSQIPEKEKIFEIISTKEGMYALENFILQLSRIFGDFAFKNTEHTELLNIKLNFVLKKYPEFKAIEALYLREVSLLDINMNLTEEESQEQKKELVEYLK